MALCKAELPLNSGHQETTPLKLYFSRPRVRVRTARQCITRARIRTRIYAHTRSYNHAHTRLKQRCMRAPELCSLVALSLLLYLIFYSEFLTSNVQNFSPIILEISPIILLENENVHTYKLYTSVMLYITSVMLSHACAHAETIRLASGLRD